MSTTRIRRRNVTVTETSLIPEMRRRLEELAKTETHIGMQGDEDLAMIAGVLEFGSAKNNVPSRPFVRLGKRRANAGINKLVKAGLEEIATGSMEVDKLHQDIGELGLTKMEQAFDKMKKPALSAVYAAQKGSKKLLIDERTLREALTFRKVRR